MVDTSMIDTRAFYEQYVALAGKPSRAWRTGEMEYHGNCPWCGGVDRFAFWSSGRYSCSIRASGCGRYGRDVIDFLREYEGLGFVAACDLLGIDPENAYQRLAHHPPATDDRPPAKSWQERASAVIHRARRLLWSPSGHAALAYLRGRGFTDETIRAAALGYIPRTHDGGWYLDAPELWGIAQEESVHEGVWLPEGVLIPWSADGHIWKLHIRRLGGLKDGDARYVQVKGSREGLYNADAIRTDTPLVLCESEFDALSGQQVCGEGAAFVATGAVTRARRDRWLARMGLASCALVAYDDDPPDRCGKRAGDAGAAYWVKALPHAVGWAPWAHDVNDMLQQGQDLRTWVTLGVAVAASIEEAGPTGPSLYGGVSEEARSANGGTTSSPELQGNAICRPSAVCCGNTTLQMAVPVFSSMGQSSPPVPLNLPPLPRRHCRFELVRVGGDNRVRAARCPGKALANGWCEAHQHAQELLDLGARLGYPRLEVTPHRAIGRGQGSWEAYAARATARWLLQDIPRIKAIVEQQRRG